MVAVVLDVMTVIVKVTLAISIAGQFDVSGWHGSASRIILRIKSEAGSTADRLDSESVRNPSRAYGNTRS